MSSKQAERARWLRNSIDLHARRKLPRPVYRSLIRGYHGARTRTGRNPGRDRLLPEFVIIGAAKAGTTSLYGWLREHPFVAPATKKEVHYFDYNYYRGEDWYRSHFPLQGERDRFAVEHGRPFTTGEASPSYITHDWAPQRLAQLLPEARLIVSLRNPIDRAYSQFQMTRREQEEPLESFAEAVAIESTRLDRERVRTRGDEWYNSWPIGCWSYLMRSRYAEQLERWFELFQREQFHFLTLEELAAEPQRVLDGVHEFLGLPAHAYPALEPLHVAPRYGAISEETRVRLTEYFRPHNERLYELLGVDLGWERPTAEAQDASDQALSA
ncbi:MAG: sulfotransferase domain-containing protein [Actinobacteria bacterium]|nr:sulfotransferase domain-containing protein [Actinomycetota bacterium]